MENVNLFLEFVQFLADHYCSPICVNTVNKMYVFNLPYFSHWIIILIYKACLSESGTEVAAAFFPAVELCDFSCTWQCMSGEIWYKLDSGSVWLTETEAR